MSFFPPSYASQFYPVLVYCHHIYIYIYIHTHYDDLVVLTATPFKIQHLNGQSQLLLSLNNYSKYSNILCFIVKQKSRFSFPIFTVKCNQNFYFFDLCDCLTYFHFPFSQYSQLLNPTLLKTKEKTAEMLDLFIYLTLWKYFSFFCNFGATSFPLLSRCFHCLVKKQCNAASQYSHKHITLLLWTQPRFQAMSSQLDLAQMPLAVAFQRFQV